MLKLPKSEFTVPFDGSFKLADMPNTPSDTESKKHYKNKLADLVDEMSELQRILYAHDKHSLLLVFQAMDAAGKDSTIRAVMSGVDPTGCQVFSFKRPSSLELDHDFLWRTHSKMPERGRIGVFNRSYYEEVLVVKVHPEYLGGQRITLPEDTDAFWGQRYESINCSEAHLVNNGTRILKFFLNVSADEQKRRFMSRIQTPEKNWKFSSSDLKERALWPHYQQAYQDLLNATSTEAAPWHAIPADNKPYMRWQVAQIIRQTLEDMNPQFPAVDADDKAKLGEYERQLLSE